LLERRVCSCSKRLQYIKLAPFQHFRCIQYLLPSSSQRLVFKRSGCESSNPDFLMRLTRWPHCAKHLVSNEKLSFSARQPVGHLLPSPSELSHQEATRSLRHSNTWLGLSPDMHPLLNRSPFLPGGSLRLPSKSTKTRTRPRQDTTRPTTMITTCASIRMALGLTITSAHSAVCPTISRSRSRYLASEGARTVYEKAVKCGASLASCSSHVSGKAGTPISQRFPRPLHSV
jgi:hypothetical protein